MVAHTKAAGPNVINGINVDDLFALIDGIKRDEAKVPIAAVREYNKFGADTRKRTFVGGWTKLAYRRALNTIAPVFVTS